MKRHSAARLHGRDSSALQELKTSLHSTRLALSQAYTAFNYTSDPELTDACIFEIRSLQSRMNYLLREIKTLEDRAAAVASGSRRARWT